MPPGRGRTRCYRFQVINSYWTAGYDVFTNEFASGVRLNREHREDEEQIDLRKSETCHTARRCYKSQRTTRFLSAASEQAAYARMVEHEHIYIIFESVMVGNSSTPLRREYSETCQDRISYSNEVFISTWTLVIEVQVPSQQLGNSKSWVRISRGIEYFARHFVLQRLTTKSSQSAAGVREHQVTGGHSPVRHKAAPKSKLVSSGPSQRVGHWSQQKR